jgi:hypothetical protein
MTSFPRASVEPEGAAYRIAEVLCHPDVSIIGAGAVVYRLAEELGVVDQVQAEITRRLRVTL